jgi:1,4-alpha-glucan branching enzyme
MKVQQGWQRRSLVGVIALVAGLAALPAMAQVSTKSGIGATPYSGGVTFRVFAPFATTVAVKGDFNSFAAPGIALSNEGNGYWSHDVAGALDGQQYKYTITNGANTYVKNDPRARDVTNSVGNSIIRGTTFDWSTYGSAITLFSDNFDRATIGSAWTVSGTSTYRVQTSTTYKAAGTYGCTFDSSASSTYQTSQLTKTIDASAYGALTLTYKVRNVGEETDTADGVFISNNGTTWYKVGSYPAISSTFSTQTIDLTAAAATAGITPGTTFKIRFQEYDNSPLPSDGLAIDDVSLTGKLKSPSYTTPNWNEMVVYELHIGTFNDAAGGIPGTFDTAIQRLDQLQALGVNAVEVMPLAEFAGDFSWGYNPAAPYAPESIYGGLLGYKRFVNECHARGIAVIQDIVFNHFGPSDLDMWQFDGWSQNGYGGVYFYNDYRAVTPWGNTRPDYGRGEIRNYLRDNAIQWLSECRADGLRWDSTVNIRTVNNGGGGDLPDGYSLMQYINNEIDSSQGYKISIAEDLQSASYMTQPTGSGGAGFDSQWDAQFFHPIRDNIITSADSSRDMNAVKTAITANYNGSATQRVIYTESHDEVANGHARVPEEIYPGNAGSWYSRKRSTLGAAVVMTAPGIPMIFEGQEVLEDGYFQDTDPVDWSKLTTYSGIQTMYRDMIRLRRNWFDTTRGLRGNNVNVFHVNNTNKVIAYHRWQNGGAKDDCVIVCNFANTSYTSYNLGFPRGGTWKVRFNSDWNGYSADFANTNAYDTTANSGAKDGLNFNGNIGIGPYTVIILSQDN